MAARRFGAILAGAALAASACGCPAAKREAPPPQGDAGVAAPADRGLRLSLPPGWEGRVEGPDRLAIGPPGRTIARLERSSAVALPSPEELQRLFSVEVSGGSVREVESDVGAGYVRWLGRVEAEGGGGWPVGLCALWVDGAVFFGGSVPGATLSEVRAALEACASLEPGSPTR